MMKRFQTLLSNATCAATLWRTRPTPPPSGSLGAAAWGCLLLLLLSPLLIAPLLLTPPLRMAPVMLTLSLFSGGALLLTELTNYALTPPEYNLSTNQGRGEIINCPPVH